MRLYLPATTADLAAQLITARRAHAATQALQAALPEEDEEGLEACAHLCAADASTMLLVDTAPGKVLRRRVVIAADVEAEAVRDVAAGEDVLPGTVELLRDLEWSDAAAFFVDESEISEDLHALKAGDEEAFERIADRDLLWYDVTERRAVVSALKVDGQ